MTRRTIITTLLAAALAGPGAGVLTAQAPAASAAGHPDFTLKIRAKQAEAKVGSEIWIEIETTNTSSESFMIQAGNPPFWAEYRYKTYVRDEKGDLAPETKLGRIIRTGKDDEHPNGTVIWAGSGGVFRELRPGETAEKDEIILNRLYDLRKPGKYSVQVTAGPKDDPTKIARSNTITVTVTAP
jgi:hypothetical protein